MSDITVGLKIVGLYYFREFEFSEPSGRDSDILDVMNAAKALTANPKLDFKLDDRGFMQGITITHIEPPISSKLNDKGQFSRGIGLPAGTYGYIDEINPDTKGPQLVWQYYLFRDYDAKNVTDTDGITKRIITSLDDPKSQDGKIKRMADARVRNRDLIVWRLVGISFNPSNTTLRQQQVNNGVSEEKVSSLKGMSTRTAIASLGDNTTNVT